MSAGQLHVPLLKDVREMNVVLVFVLGNLKCEPGGIPDWFHFLRVALTYGGLALLRGHL